EGEVRVLHGTTVRGEERPELRIGRAEAQPQEPWMIQHALDRRHDVAHEQRITRAQRRRRRTVLGARAPVPGTEYDRIEARLTADRGRRVRGEAHLDGLACA